MKKKIIYVLLIITAVFNVTGCGNSSKLEEIANNINKSETVKKDKEYGYKIKASVKKNTLTITTTIDKNKNEAEFYLKDNIISNENLTVDDLVSTLVVLNGIGQTQGYKDGEISQNINAFPDEYKKYSLNNEGLELITKKTKLSLKVDLSKKIPLIDISKYYLKTDDLNFLKDYIKDNQTGNQTGKSGNIAYDITLGETENTIKIGQEGSLSDSAYKSILSALEVMYGKNVANHFQEIYPNFVDGKKTVEAFTIDTEHKPEKHEESLYKDTSVALITINNQAIIH